MPLLISEDKPSTTNTGSPIEMQDGYGDQSETAVTPVLVVRGLEPNVNESVLAKGVQKLFKSASNASNGAPKNAITKLTSTTNPANLGAKDGSLHRVLLIRDKRSDASWRFGFAEFFSIQVRWDLDLFCQRFANFLRMLKQPWQNTKH